MKQQHKTASSPRWYVVYTKPRQESVARENLERQGYKIYLPLIKQQRRIGGVKKSKISPLFPRYLFIRLTEGKDNWSPIRSTIGAVKLVEFGHRPSTVPDQLIKLLKNREDNKGLQPEITKHFKKGDKVRLSQGPLEGYEAVFLSQSSKERVFVLLSLMGAESKVNVDLTDLELSS